ncbi:hypothetical protein LCGC14_1170010 [marine sediment metagenome]|uniref:Uncharacterized protein n=1 Tax=marine sediment metagenome TaxID=412755 RepID=A0A0F9LUY8_9ZZZZ
MTGKMPDSPITEKDVLAAMPLFFVPAGGKKVTRESLDRLFEAVRKSLEVKRRYYDMP